MNYFRKAVGALGIRVISAGVGFAVEAVNLMDFQIIEFILIALTAAILVLTVYSGKFKRIFPYFLLIKSGFDVIYMHTLNSPDYITGLIIVANTIFGMVFTCDLLIKHLLSDGKCSRFTGIAFTVCFLIPYIAVFLSVAAIAIAILFYEISVLLIFICMIVNACIFFKVCFVYINLLLLTVNK